MLWWLLFSAQISLKGSERNTLLLLVRLSYSAVEILISCQLMLRYFKKFDYWWWWRSYNHSVRCNHHFKIWFAISLIVMFESYLWRPSGQVWAEKISRQLKDVLFWFIEDNKSVQATDCPLLPAWLLILFGSGLDCTLVWRKLIVITIVISIVSPPQGRAGCSVWMTWRRSPWRTAKAPRLFPGISASCRHWYSPRHWSPAGWRPGSRGSRGRCWWRRCSWSRRWTRRSPSRWTTLS